MTKTIYLVTDGDPYAYRVCGVFDNEGWAQMYVEIFGGVIEEEELNPLVKELRAGYCPYRVDLKSDTGDVIEVVEIRSTLVQYHSGGFEEKHYRGFVMARDEDHAIEIVRNRWMAAIAYGLGD